MSSKARTVSELRTRLVEKATEDEAFRARLLADPKAAIEEELDLTIPAGFTVSVHEDGPDTSHLVLPPPSELGEAELRQVTGSQRTAWDNIRDELTIWDG